MAPSPTFNSSGPLVQPDMALDDFLESFWTSRMELAESEDPDFKHHVLPLARIKKVMKSDEDVQMISAEAPIIFSRACELFISELTCRSYLVAEAAKRKTLQRADVGKATAGSDQFDFLLDCDVAGTGGFAGGKAAPPTGVDGGEKSKGPKKGKKRKSSGGNGEDDD
ncbi:histone-fold-containing protein [Mrakia frigida]|uniref:histone-fold-containing protein n=1 Tax=Mrakia frigida TaxID=29902 RepID=UPI003FCC1F1E